MKKIVIFAFLFLIIINISYGYTKNQFTNGDTEITTYLNLTYNISINVPLYSNVTNFTFEIEDIDDILYKEFADSVAVINPGSVGNYTNMYDGDWSTHNFGASGESQLYQNYTFPAGFTNNGSFWSYKINAGTSGNLSVNSSYCQLVNGELLTVVAVRPTAPRTRFYCYNFTVYDNTIFNGANWTELYHDDTSNQFAEDGLYLLSNMSTPTNVTNLTIYFRNQTDAPVNLTGIFEFVKVNLTTQINDILPECNCSNCQKDDYNCYIDINITSKTEDYININTLEINYTYPITFLVKDENTNSLITSKNALVDVISSSQSFNYTTNTGNDTFDLLLNNYTVRYSADGYSTRQRVLNIDGSTNTYDLYLSNSTNTQEITFVVLNQFFERVSNAVVVIEKYFIDESKFNDIAELLTNVNGEASIALSTETELYRYRIYYNDVLEWNESNINGEPIYPTDTTFTFKINLGRDLYEITDILDSITAGINFVNLTNNTGYFTLWFYSDENYTMCLRMINASKNSIINETCLTSNNGEITYNYFINQTTLFSALGLLSQNGQKYVKVSKSVEIGIPKTNPFDQNTSYEGWFFAILGILLIAIGLSGYPEASVIGAGLVLSVLIKMDIIQLSPGYKIATITSILFLSGIVSFVIYGARK